MNSVVGTVKRVLKAYTDAVSTITEPDKKRIDKITSTSGDATYALMEEIEACARVLRPSVPSNPKLAAVHRIVVALLDYASKADFKLQCYFRENPRPAVKLS